MYFSPGSAAGQFIDEAFSGEAACSAFATSGIVFGTRVAASQAAGRD